MIIIMIINKNITAITNLSNGDKKLITASAPLGQAPFCTACASEKIMMTMMSLMVMMMMSMIMMAMLERRWRRRVLVLVMMMYVKVGKWGVGGIAINVLATAQH